jgi:membrane protease YdiL (CAAX protease family)
MNNTDTPQHSLGETITYHLLPGVAILVGYVLITPFVRAAGLPSAIGISLAVLLVLVPLELGILFWQGRKCNGKFSLEGIVLNREKTPTLQFAIWTFVALFAAVLCFTLFSPLDKILLAFFGWLPNWFFVNEDLSVYSKTIQFVNWLAIFLLTGIVGPYVEELYFRGFLLPRLTWMKGWAPLIEAFLFALYHFWSPWQLVTRTLAVLALVYIVNRKRDLRIGVTAHWLLNTVGSIELLIAVFK